MKKLLTTTTIIGVLALNTMAAEAAMKKRVTFESQGQTLVGDLYLPDNYKQGDKLPGVVVSGSWTSVKEQMAGGYAEKLADEGYAALAFDFRGWGQSNVGTPTSLQYVEHPGEKTKDILAAADFLASRPEVASNQLATLGICASAGYAIDAAFQSDKISATATVAPWLHDKEVVDQVYGENVPALLQATADAQASDKPVILEAAGEKGSGAVMEGAVYYTDPNRGAIPEYDDKFSALSWGPWLNYDAIQTASKITKPVLLVHSEAAAIPQGAKKFVAEGGDNIELVMIDNVTQFDFYDKPESVDAAVRKVVTHFETSFK